MCPCGHHEGYHHDNGECLHAYHYSKCGCTGIPSNCVSTDDERIAPMNPLLTSDHDGHDSDEKGQDHG